MDPSLTNALDGIRGFLLDDAALVRAVASGRRRGEQPRWRRVEMRYVDLKAGRRLQVTAYDETQAFTTNHEDAATAVDDLLAEPFGNWHVETDVSTYQLRVTKKGRALTHATVRTDGAAAPDRSHDRDKERLLRPDHPVLRELDISDAAGKVRPSRQAKYRQVDEFLRALAAALDDAMSGGRLRTPTTADPWQVVDLGCGNAYLTFAAQAWLDERDLPARLVGVDVKEQARRHNSEVAERLGVGERIEFVVGTIDGVTLAQPPDVVLALHACDTATDDALARAVDWDATVVLAAPCCHHDVAAQLRNRGAPAPYSLLVRDGILRERLADTLTDALRAALLRAEGYRVEVIEFVPSRHTPRNTLLRAVRTGASGVRDEYDELVAQWHLRPKLADLLEQPADPKP
ncbi:class I SAM-dependent methyltransferase [Nocardioides terrisoli]|uniref:class I SAM-dependent methyltransferase n=1 Tax=Nocardioides terrisoli TaxID=3388267 RepID=UPI00287B8F45|nr:SAM-dependent methyltransferase [Nocardioides marmorisolisilvae]